MKALFAASVVLLLASSSAAQQKTLEFRTGDAVKGPVKSVRVERADFVEVNGEFVEGARRLIHTKEYTPDGKRSVTVGYFPDGRRRSRSVHVYDDGGNLIDEAHYDEENVQRVRKTYVRRGDELLTFDGDGRLLERRVTTWNEARDKMVEVRRFDGNGALIERQVNTRDESGNNSVWTTYGPDGNPCERSVHSLNYGGDHRTEQTKFNPDGSVAGTRVATSDDAVNKLGAVESGPDGVPLRRKHATWEYDARRNLIKQTTSRWDEAKGRFVPFAVTYADITYYR